MIFYISVTKICNIYRRGTTEGEVPIDNPTP